MKINPELKRYIWLDFSLHRTLLTALIIGLLCYAFKLLYGFESSAALAFSLVCFFIFFWGTKSASEAVTSEIQNRTWDFQRQTALSPWAMTWGKLLGSTLFSWFAALISFAFYAFMNTKDTSKLYPFSTELPTSWEFGLLIIGGLFSQALCLLFSMQSIDQQNLEKDPKSFRYFIAGTIIGIFVMHYCFRALASHGTVEWHRFEINQGPFAFFTLLFFFIWSIIGLQRLFSKALDYAHWPWIWALFTAFCILYFSGLAFNSNQIEAQASKAIPQAKNLTMQLRDLIAFLTAIVLTYFALFTDSLGKVTYFKLIARYKEKSLSDVFLQLPKWPVSLLFVVFITVYIVIKQMTLPKMYEDFSVSILFISTLLFLIRDILIFHYFNFKKSKRNPSATIAVYLFMLYMLAPLLLQALKLQNLMPLFLPSWGQNNALAFIGLFLQIGFMGMLCWQEFTANKALANNLPKLQKN